MCNLGLNFSLAVLAACGQQQWAGQGAGFWAAQILRPTAEEPRSSAQSDVGAEPSQIVPVSPHTLLCCVRWARRSSSSSSRDGASVGPSAAGGWL